MTRLRILTGLLLAPVLVLSTAAAASSSSRSIPIPDDFQPEGIAVEGSTFYVGSLKDGDIYRGDLETGKGEVFIDVSGRAALGMKVDAERHRLFVGGGPSGRAYVYGTKKGRTLATFRFTKPGQTLVNDVVVTERAAYFTETLAPRIYKVPIAPDGSFGKPRTITVTGPAAATGDLGLNGIDATRGGSTLIVDHTTLGALFTVNPSNGRSRQITITKGTLAPGTLDGILLDGKDLWVVQNAVNTLANVRLSPDLKSGEVVAAVRDPLFRFPTTVADYGCELALVNARFDLGFPPPFGPGAPPGTDFDVVVLKKP